MPPTGSMLISMATVFRACWKQLAATDILYKIVAFILLTPVVGILFRVLVSLSGRTVLADEDMLLFLLEPLGWITLIAIGAMWLAITALEIAALMQIVASEMCRRRISVRTALHDTALRARLVVTVTARLIAFCLMIAAPFLAVAGFVYASLLTEFDINFYLQERPPVFLAAVGIGGLLASVLCAILIWFLSGWVLALPLAVFEDVPSRSVLRESQRRSHGRRRITIAWMGAWLLLTTLFSTIAAAIVGWVGSAFVTRAAASLWLLVIIVGFVLILLSIVNLVINLFSMTTFAVLLVHLYEQHGDGELEKINWRPRRASAGIERFFHLSRRSFAAMAAVAVLVAGAIGYTMLTGVGTQDHTQITAHRGASASAPENTLAAIKQAIEDGADWVEIDVQESADGQVVVVHDSDLKKIGRSGMKIWESTAEQLQSVDVGSWFDPKFSNERIPLLAEVLEICKGEVGVNIELKYYGHEQNLETRVVDLVEAAGMESDVVVMSLKQAGIDKMRKLRPDWKYGLLTAMALGDLTRSDVDFLAVNTGLATRSFVRSAHAADKEVYVWTVNDPVAMSMAMGRGIDSLITDKPGLAKSVLAQRKQLSSVERLLLEVASLLGASPPTSQNIEDF